MPIISIHHFLQPGQSLVLGRDRREYHAFDKEKLNLDGYDQLPRQITEHVDGAKAKQSFNDLRTSLTEEQMMLETERCLGCGATVVVHKMRKSFKA